MILIIKRTYDSNGNLISTTAEVEELCACSYPDGKKNLRFTHHSEYECYGNGDLGILRV